jgi:hypothetical protein
VRALPHRQFEPKSLLLGICREIPQLPREFCRQVGNPQPICRLTLIDDVQC